MKEEKRKTLFYSFMLMLAFFSIYLFMGGFHNMDNCQNIERLSCDTGMHYVENNLFHKNVPLPECYMRGAFMNIGGMMLMTYVVLCLFITSLKWK